MQAAVGSATIHLSRELGGAGYRGGMKRDMMYSGGLLHHPPTVHLRTFHSYVCILFYSHHLFFLSLLLLPPLFMLLVGIQRLAHMCLQGRLNYTLWIHISTHHKCIIVWLVDSNCRLYTRQCPFYHGLKAGVSNSGPTLAYPALPRRPYHSPGGRPALPPAPP